MLAAALLAGTFSIAMYQILAQDLYRKTAMTMRSNLSQIQYAVERQLDDMVRATLYLSYSTEARDLLYQLGTYSLTSDQKQGITTRLRKQMGDLTYYLPSLTKVAIFNCRSGLYLSVGVSDDSESAVHELSQNAEWYEQLVPADKEGSFSVVQPSPWSDNSREVLSYYRRVVNEYETQYAICEVQVPLLTFTRLLNSYQFDDLKIYVTDKEGVQLYPDRGEMLSKKVMQESQEQTEKIPDTIEIFSEVQATGWKIIAVNDMAEFNVTLRNYRLLLAVLSLLILSLMGAFFLVALRYFTSPLQKLIKKVHSITWQDIEPTLSPPKIEDLSYLNKLYGHLTEALRESVQKLSVMEREQKQAQYIALTAKMNPHFLYNALAVISAADTSCEKGTVSEMCCLLSDMLRYNTTQSYGLVTLEQEIEHVGKYLKFVKWSYGDDLSYTIELPDSAKNIPIPALALQPLAENCIRHGFTGKRAPYIVHISASHCNGRGCVVVKDNGVGFSEEAIERFKDGCRRWKETKQLDKQLPRAISGGQAMLNVFIRLCVFAGEDVSMELSKSPEGGACVTIKW